MNMQYEYLPFCLKCTKRVQDLEMASNSIQNVLLRLVAYRAQALNLDIQQQLLTQLLRLSITTHRHPLS